jgi:arylsulfatase A-like enzyme
MFLTLVIILMGLSCKGPESEQPLLTAEVPLHLEEHIDEAKIEGSEVPEDLPTPVEWNFNEPQPKWRAAVPWNPTIEPALLTQIDDALRVKLTEATRNPNGNPRGGLSIDLPDWRREDWAYVLVRARTSEEVTQIGIGFNGREGSGTATDFPYPYACQGDSTIVVRDGTVHTYLMRTDLSVLVFGEYEDPWQELGLWFAGADEPASIDILSVTIVPTEADYAYAPVGVRTEIQSEALRRTLYTHTPGRLEYRVRVPEAGRLDVGLGVLREDVPVSFRITAEPAGGEAETMIEETYADQERWAQRSVALSHLAGRTITLTLEADAKRAGTVALWAAPTLTGARATEKPNVIFYVIDGGGADHMSIYGHNRRTTPNLERLAAEGSVFEHAYSNATWTTPSTSSFLTSLHTSVLGGYEDDIPMIPEQTATMAQHLHRAGFQTALFTTNVNAGTYAGLERGVDVLRDTGAELVSYSSVELHQDYWKWRQAYPGEPYWVHFQTEDLHWAWSPKVVTPFAGLYVNPELRERYFEWDGQLEEAGGRTLAAAPNSAALAEAGIDPVVYAHARRGLCHEAMAHQDYQLGQLVERLKATGEWEHTLLIVASDHAGVYDNPKSWAIRDPMFRSAETRIPLLVFWPGRIAGGQRFSQPVSMIDVLPTILDLLGLPMPEVMQGQSLAPLLLAEEGWEPRPVILDEFEVDSVTGELTGVIEVVDGRWGASLLIKPRPGAWPESQRAAPLLLYDLWNDPYTQHSLHEERPDLVEKYTKFLEAQWEAHQALGQHFTRSKASSLTPEQLRTLRSLGYID